MLRPNQKRFVALVLFTAAIWLFVLPGLAKTELVDSRNRWLKEKGVAPSALMYADHPVAMKTLERLDQIERENRGALWIPTCLRRPTTPK
ncbi:hypothetical protein K2Y11_20555 [bacterium]|nr:hypothetical protein [bacterium]